MPFSFPASPFSAIKKAPSPHGTRPERRVLPPKFRTGRRAEYAGEALVASGYRHVYNFLGVTQWPYELVR